MEEEVEEYMEEGEEEEEEEKDKKEDKCFLGFWKACQQATTWYEGSGEVGKCLFHTSRF